jgi:biotin-(acetyl-CoA carboxylase) ligase
MIIGQQVYIIDSRAGSIGSVEDIIRETGKEPPVAKAVAIDDECALVVEFPDGRRKTLSTGEVSIRKV